MTWEWQGERDRLRDENEKLAADLGEEPMMCANTEDAEALVEQIKSLKGENDRFVRHTECLAVIGVTNHRHCILTSTRVFCSLREMQNASGNKRTRKMCT